MKSFKRGVLLAATVFATSIAPALAGDFIVTTTSDSGPGSLRQAILDANANPGADTITFSIPSYSTIFLTSGEIPITDDLTVSSMNGPSITIDANGNSRIFSIAGGKTVTLTRLYMANGKVSGNGGAILNNGNLSLTWGSILSSTASGSGGAIYSDHGQLFIRDTYFLFNANKASNGSGGAIYINGGTFDLRGQPGSEVQFTSNTATTAGQYGGALFNNAGSGSISYATLSYNQAHGAGAIYNLSGSIDIRSASFSQNKATGNSGGAIINETGSTLVIDSSIFTMNQAQSAPLGSGGGAIANRGALTVVGGYMNGNATSQKGGAIAHIAGSLILGNGCPSFAVNTAAADNSTNNYWDNTGGSAIILASCLRLDASVGSLPTIPYREVGYGADIDLVAMGTGTPWLVFNNQTFALQINANTAATFAGAPSCTVVRAGMPLASVGCAAQFSAGTITFTLTSPSENLVANDRIQIRGLSLTTGTTPEGSLISGTLRQPTSGQTGQAVMIFSSYVNLAKVGPSSAPTGMDAITSSMKTLAEVTSIIDRGEKVDTIKGVLVPDWTHRGVDGAMFVFAYLPDSVAVAPGTVWYLDSGLNWQLFQDCRTTPAYVTGALDILRNIPIVALPTNLAPYRGAELYLGYGLGGYSAPSGSACNDMLTGKRFVKVYTVE